MDLVSQRAAQQSGRRVVEYRGHSPPGFNMGVLPFYGFVAHMAVDTDGSDQEKQTDDVCNRVPSQKEEVSGKSGQSKEAAVEGEAGQDTYQDEGIRHSTAPHSPSHHSQGKCRSKHKRQGKIRRPVPVKLTRHAVEKIGRRNMLLRKTCQYVMNHAKDGKFLRHDFSKVTNDEGDNKAGRLPSFIHPAITPNIRNVLGMKRKEKENADGEDEASTAVPAMSNRARDNPRAKEDHSGQAKTQPGRRVSKIGEFPHPASTPVLRKILSSESATPVAEANSCMSRKERVAASTQPGGVETPGRWPAPPMTTVHVVKESPPASPAPSAAVVIDSSSPASPVVVVAATHSLPSSPAAARAAAPPIPAAVARTPLAPAVAGYSSTPQAAVAPAQRPPPVQQMSTMMVPIGAPRQQSAPIQAAHPGGNAPRVIIPVPSASIPAQQPNTGGLVHPGATAPYQAVATTYATTSHSYPHVPVPTSTHDSEMEAAAARAAARARTITRPSPAEWAKQQLLPPTTPAQVSYTSVGQQAGPQTAVSMGQVYGVQPQFVPLQPSMFPPIQRMQHIITPGPIQAGTRFVAPTGAALTYAPLHMAPMAMPSPVDSDVASNIAAPPSVCSLAQREHSSMAAGSVASTHRSWTPSERSGVPPSPASVRSHAASSSADVSDILPPLTSLHAPGLSATGNDTHGRDQHGRDQRQHNLPSSSASNNSDLALSHPASTRPVSNSRATSSHAVTNTPLSGSMTAAISQMWDGAARPMPIQPKDGKHARNTHQSGSDQPEEGKRSKSHRSSSRDSSRAMRKRKEQLLQRLGWHAMQVLLRQSQQEKRAREEQDLSQSEPPPLISTSNRAHHAEQ
ncbi:mucin-17-like [Sycon ciliatum]|uniref:mucin-17-like n=1 Tax=Sycon ciliatum TaxID=27933 RepID=UPI0020AD4155|eukprot:scpid13895/ scgid33830/ 